MKKLGNYIPDGTKICKLLCKIIHHLISVSHPQHINKRFLTSYNTAPEMLWFVQGLARQKRQQWLPQ